MKRISNFIMFLAFVFYSGVAQSEEFAVHTFAGYPSCDSQSADGPQKAFRCCVIAADTIEFSQFPQLTSFTLRSRQCPYSDLQEITFRLNEVASNGVHVYEWYRPALDTTPFVSPNRQATRGWMSFYPQFKLGQPYAWNEFIRFIDSRLVIEEQELPGLYRRLFSAELDSNAGWKKINTKIVNQREFSEPCVRFPHIECHFRTTTFDQTWQNTYDPSKREIRTASSTERLE